MSVGKLLRSSYLLYFSQPAANRALYRAIHRRPIQSIVELGVDLAGRTARLLEVVRWQQSATPLRYTGIDQFDARPKTEPSLSLKQAFAALRSPSLRLQLVPGDPMAALARVANSLASTDLLIISASQDRDALAQAWTWAPRMLTGDSLIFLEERTASAGQASWRRLKLADVDQLAAAANKTRRHAA